MGQARKLEAQSCFTLPHKHKITRSRVPQEKIEHFLEFLLLSALLQDVAYGISNIKFENGERQEVSNAILTMQYNHTISYYKKFCLDIGYEPISDSSSWRILKEINPSPRKALAGLDDITAAGMNGFTSLSKVSEIMSDKMLTKNIGKGKRYLKSSFPTNCSNVSKFKTHSTTFGLSDKADEMLAERSTTIEVDCDEFIEIFSCLKFVEEFVKEKGDDDMIYDVSVAIEDIKTYIKHQVRDAKQKLAKVLASQSIKKHHFG